MNPAIPYRLTVTVTPSFWDAYSAVLTVMRQGFWRIVILSIFPLAGVSTIALLVYEIATGHRMGMAETLKGLFISLISLTFPLYLPALLIWLARRNSRHLLGSVEYAFDAEGMHLSGSTFQQSLSWSAILRVRRTRKFILIFLTQKMVYPMPLRQVSDPQFFENLRALGGERTDFGGDRPLAITNQPVQFLAAQSEFQPSTDSVTPQRLSLTIRASFWEMVSANLVMILQRPQSLVLFSLFPLAGLLVLAFSLRELAAGRLDTAGVWSCLVFAPVGILFPLLIVIFSVWSVRRGNKLAQDPIVYSFDTEGMHLSGAAFQSKVFWSAILRVRRTRQFILIFLTPTQAHVIPLRQVDNSHFFEELRVLAGAQTDFCPVDEH